MKLPRLRSGMSHLPAGGTFFVALAMFVLSIIAVFYGFTGYYTRVSLSSELKNNEGKNIDVLFMQINQLDRDEEELRALRKSRVNAGTKYATVLAKQMSIAYSSKEYRDYVVAIGDAIDIFAQSRDILNNDYWVKVNGINLQNPNMPNAELIGNPAFKPNVGLKVQGELFGRLSPVVQRLRLGVVTYAAKFGAQLQTLMSDDDNEVGLIDSGIREIVERNPQLGTAEERKKFDVALPQSTGDNAHAIAVQRAVIRSYGRALGWGSGILQWPTIVSTLLVTLSAGWLGGVVNFLGITIRSDDDAKRQSIAVEEPQIIGLLRRAILAVTAALGIFLFAGAGLLVLTAQTGKMATQGSIELNPYFVAFLAFISGFLADDAFVRMTKAGRALFRTGDIDESSSPLSTNHQ